MINVIGLGYIGLPTALMLAAHGNEVIGTDYNEELVNTLKNGKITFKEDGIEDLFETALQHNISFDTKYQTGNMYIVSVPTPYDAETKKIDPKYVISAVQSVLEVCEDDAIIVIESTISPGTIDHFIRPILDDYQKKNICIAHAPERIIPGNMIYELQHNSRTIGADSREVGEKIKEVYATFCEGEIVLTDIRTAEMTKVVENTYRDINIAFANELAKICRSDDMDVYEIIKIANKHPRVNILSPGPGVGGHCISVDPWFLVGDYPNLANIIHMARKINDSMPEFVLARAKEIMEENNIKDIKRIGFYGLTYKEDVDDVRESPTLQLIESIKKHLGSINMKFYDPMVKEDLVENQYHNLEEFLNEIDMVVIMVGHSEIISEMDKLHGKIILDTRNICKHKGVYHI